MLENIFVDEYLYELPESKIAKFPLQDREQSKLLIVSKNENEIKHSNFFNLPELIPENSLIVWNDTKVIPARIPAKKISGGKAELLLLHPVAPFSEYQSAMTAFSPVVWECVVGGRKLNEGVELFLDSELPNFSFKSKIIKRTDNKAEVEFSWNSSEGKTFSEVLELIGKIPLPPYLKRESLESDRTRYQTVYAEFDGSVAAPTAGLHFTENVINKLKSKSINFASVTLHVGLGTFKPIECESAANHEMHQEIISINVETIECVLNAIKNRNNITAIGTTSVRTLETIFWLGLKLEQNLIQDAKFDLFQFEPYQLSENFSKEISSPERSIEVLLNYCKRNHLQQISGETQLMIAPGYKFQICKSIVTNFHQPKSTLILLVAAFLGKELWKQAYNSALDNNYRFLSYGDSSFLY